MPEIPIKKTETITIENFSGRLTRIESGQLNSGFAKFSTSWGYDPFSKPMDLTWFDKPVNLKSSIVGGGAITDLVLASKIRSEQNAPFVYMIGNTGNLYKINPLTSLGNSYSDSIIGISSVKNGTSFTYGGSMEFAANASVEAIYIGHDNGVNAVRFNGTAEQKIGNSTYYITGVYRPLKQFTGKVAFGNGPTIGTIDATGTVVSTVSSIVSSIPVTSSIVSIYSQLNPPFPPETVVQDLDVTPDLNYLMITTNNITPDTIDGPISRQAIQASDSTLYKWNGSDTATTAGTTISAYAATALQTYLQNHIFFSNDAFGSSISDGVNKILTLPNNKAPAANATGSTGNFLYWTCPEVSDDETTSYATLYYFGSLDQENPAGLYRLMRLRSSLSGGFVTSAPMTNVVSNSYKGLNNTYSSIVTVGFGKHYFSTVEVNHTFASVGSGSVLGFYGFSVNPTGTVAPQNGVYETQTQIFSKRIGISQVRVYTEPTVAGNGFQLDLIGSDEDVIENGTFNYTFAAGSDPTKMEGSLERINFNPSMKTIYALAIRLTNTGTSNMVIKKVEIDYSEEGK